MLLPQKNIASIEFFYSNPITPTYGTINIVRINTDPTRGELVLRVESFLFVSDSYPGFVQNG